MSFLSPGWLVLLVLPVALAVAYLVRVRRREKYAVRFTNVELLDRIAPDRPGWRRHVPAAALLLGLVALSVAVARPAMAIQVAKEESTVILAIDVSLSMEATDVEPSRIEAAKDAAREFVRLAPDELRIGIVAFAGSAFGTLQPTTDRELTKTAIDRLQLGEGTAIGEGIFAALDMIEADAIAREVDPATDESTAIVVLSDGETTVGRPDLDAADAAVEAGVPVFTISFGTNAGIVTYQGETIPVPVNQGALEEVATTTGGEFFTAVSEEELARILDAIGTEVGTETEQREITQWFAGGGLVLVMLAAAGSLMWSSRLP